MFEPLSKEAQILFVWGFFFQPVPSRVASCQTWSCGDASGGMARQKNEGFVSKAILQDRSLHLTNTTVS